MPIKQIKVFSMVFAMVLLVSSICCVVYADTIHNKRQRNDEVLVFNDSEFMELFYYLEDDQSAADIEVFLYVGDGPISLGNALRIEPGETVSTMQTDAYGLFTPGIYPGAIVIRNADTGLIQKREPVSIRIYAHYYDPYDILDKPDNEYELNLDEKEASRKEYYDLQLFLREGTIMIDYSGINAQNRSLDLEIVAIIGGQEIPIAIVNHIGPGALCLSSDVLPEALPILEVGAVYEARLDVFYTDTGELFETRAGEIEVLN